MAKRDGSAGQLRRGESDRERYRYRCAVCDSANWQQTGTHVWCQQCWRDGRPAAREWLLDWQTGEFVQYECVGL